MKRMLNLITMLCISSSCQAAQPKAPGQLPQFDKFMQLPVEKQAEIFDFYLGDTIPQIYKNLSVWNQVSDYFKAFAQYGAGSSIVDRKVNNIFNSMSMKTREYAQRLKPENESLSSIAGLLSLQDPTTITQLQEAKIEPGKGYLKIKSRLNDILFRVTTFPNTISIMKLLVNNGASVNHQENIFLYKPYGCYSPLSCAISSSVQRMFAATKVGQQLNADTELANLKFLLARGANPNKNAKDIKTHLEYVVDQYTASVQPPIDPLYQSMIDYLFKAANLLLINNATITFKVKSKALKAQKEYNRPELYNLIEKYRKPRSIFWDWL